MVISQLTYLLSGAHHHQPQDSAKSRSFTPGPGLALIVGGRHFRGMDHQEWLTLFQTRFVCCTCSLQLRRCKAARWLGTYFPQGWMHQRHSQAFFLAERMWDGETLMECEMSCEQHDGDIVSESWVIGYEVSKKSRRWTFKPSISRDWQRCD